jgi:hypothetical protein
LLPVVAYTTPRSGFGTTVPPHTATPLYPGGEVYLFQIGAPVVASTATTLPRNEQHG